MITISQEAYRFLLDSYESAVEDFFDDPIGYSDSDPIQQTFDELKKLGEELNTDMLALAQAGDIDRIKEHLQEEEEDGDVENIKDVIPYWEGVRRRQAAQVPNNTEKEEDQSIIEEFNRLYGENQTPSERHQFAMSKCTKKYVPSAYRQSDNDNKSIEEKLKQLSEARRSETIGEYTTYEIKED